MTDKRVRLLSPMGWHRKENPTVSSSSTNECHSPAKEFALSQILDLPSGAASITLRRTLLDKDPHEHQPETSKQTFAEDEDECSRYDSSMINCTSSSSNMYAKCTSVETQSPEPSATKSAPSTSLSNLTEHELVDEDSRLGASSFCSWDNQLHMSSCEQKEMPQRCWTMSSSEEFFPMVSEVYYLLMKSNRNRWNKEKASYMHKRRLNQMELDTDSAYEEECIKPDKGQSNDVVDVPLIRIDDWDKLMNQELTSNQS